LFLPIATAIRLVIDAPQSMAQPSQLILGESSRTLDERFRLTIPTELLEPLIADGERCILAKERPGCLSLWNATAWQEKLDAGVELVTSKIKAGRLEGRIEQVQLLGRLLSTRHREVQIGNRGRLLIPEGFREFLNLEPGGDALIVGAAVCVEIWNREAWLPYLDEQIPEFRQLLDDLSG
jgi:MraZ protein